MMDLFQYKKNDGLFICEVKKEENRTLTETYKSSIFYKFFTNVLQNFYKCFTKFLQIFYKCLQIFYKI